MGKKKIRDLTIWDLLNNLKCEKCSNCPFNDDEKTFKDKVCSLVAIDYNEEEINEEVEVEDER